MSSYLFPFSQGDNLNQTQNRPYAPTHTHAHHTVNLITPPSSLNSVNPSPGIHSHFPSHSPYASLPLTPVSSSSPDRTYPPTPTPPFPNNHTPSHAKPPIPLIPALFPMHASQVFPLSHRLEIVTPPDIVLQGFITDHPHLGRTVFVHLPPPHISTHNRPEILQPNFSEVLRPHDPMHHRQVLPPSPSSSGMVSSLALDIKESLTALLDLASDSLEAKSLVLALDRDDREPERLDELLHSLMYAGGVVIRPGGLDGGWEWDTADWVLVGIEL